MSRDELGRICRHTGATPLYDLSELTPTAAYLGTAAVVRHIALGSRICTHIQPTVASPPMSPSPHTILLAAPSDGIGQQYKQAMLRGFRALRLWSAMPRPFLVGGAGAVELALSTHCNDRAEECRRAGDAAGVGWRVMAAALLAVPRALYSNACGEEAGTASRFIDVLVGIKAAVAATPDSAASLGLGERPLPCHRPVTSRCRASDHATSPRSLCSAQFNGCPSSVTSTPSRRE